MVTRGEVAVALRCLGRLLRFDGTAIEEFDSSMNGVWKSFWVALYVMPVWALMVADHLVLGHAPSPTRLILCKAIAYAVSWVAFPLLMVRVCDYLGRWPRYTSYIVAYNWFQLVQSAAWLPLILLVDTKIAPSGMVAVLWLGTHGVILGYNWFIARRALLIDGATATALVIIDFLLSLLIDGIADSLS